MSHDFSDKEAARHGIKEFMPNVLRKGSPDFHPDSVRSGDSLSNLMHKIGHEIGNPLTAIIALATIMERFQGESSPSDVPGSSPYQKVNSYSTSIIDEAWRISGLNEKVVLLLSTKPGNLGCCVVTEVLAKAAQKFKSRHKRKRIEVRVAPPELPEPIVWADYEQVLALFTEAITNAYQSFAYRSDDAPPVPPIVDVTIDRVDGFIRTTFSNLIEKPLPFPPEELFAAAVTEHGDRKHVGLGLTVGWTIVHRFHGRIAAAELDTPEGLRFSLEILLPESPSD